MSNPEKRPEVQFGLTMIQKVLYMIVPVVLSVIIVLMGPLMTGTLGTILFLALGLLLGLVTFFISAGWGYSLRFTGGEIKINDKRVQFDVPLDKIGMLVKNGGFPFPTMWLVLRNAGMGNEFPAKGVDPKTRELIDAYQRRNPGRTLTYVPVPGGHIRSISDFAQELKSRIPAITVDDRLPVK